MLQVPASPQTLQVAIALPEGTKLDQGQTWQLAEIGQPGPRWPAQIVPAAAEDGSIDPGRFQLLASLPPRKGASTLRLFQLLAAERSPSAAQAGFRFRDLDPNRLGLWDGDQPVLVYNHGPITEASIPEKDPRRTRACFIHPVYGLDGEVLTDAFPKDHYHHHGLFWAWPHVGIDRQEYDLWMYNNIRQRHVRWICREAGPVAAVLAVENGWFAGGKKVMIERHWLRVFKAAEGSRPIDLESVWIPVDKAITLRGAEGKSYGGVNLRFAPRKQTVITVASGPTKEDLPDTPLAWADLTGRFGQGVGPSGAAIFVHPAHPDFPPTWLTRHYGILCVGWPGVRGKTFPPGLPIRLGYRVWLHRGQPDTTQLYRAYEDYKAGLSAAVKRETVSSGQ
ncbi:MAG: DUF6807 family protein [Thermoguttaceae bacterium]